MENKRAIGTEYEKLAGKFLEQHGYEILTYNFRCHMGEIDIIAKENGYLVFVEVKYRKNDAAGSPFEAVGVKKQQIISRVAAYYCLTHGYGEETSCRFDVAAVSGTKISVIKNAFEYRY